MHAGHEHGNMNMGNQQMMPMGNLKQRLLVSVVLALPILFLAPAMGISLPFQFSFPDSDWVVVVFATILFCYGGWPFFKGACSELKERRPEMMTLITLGISTAYLYSLYAFIRNDLVQSAEHTMDFFWELATLILIMLLGHWIEMSSVMSANSSVHDLAKLLPDKVHQKQGKRTVEVEINDVKRGALILIKAGESIPLDGTILAGSSRVNESLMTGEAREVFRKKGDRVIGGSLNGSGALTVKVNSPANSGFLANVNQLVQSSQMTKSRLQDLADRVSGWLFYAALVVGLIALIVWTGMRGIGTGLERMVTVLVIACPHALGLAIPLVNAKSTAIGAKHGLLIRNRKVISVSSKLNYLLLDKTGTLTAGKFRVNKFASLSSDLDAQAVLAITASLEQDSTHPIAQSVLQFAQAKKVDLLTLTNGQNLPGEGISGTINGHHYQLVNEQAARSQVEVFPAIDTLNNTASYLIEGGTVLGYLLVGDEIKPGAQSLIKQIKKLNITPVMLTGDNREAAQGIAKKLGITEVYTDLMPEDKEKIVAQFQDQVSKVMMVGDGINDAPSLAKADIGVAIGAGTDVAVDSADVVLVNSNPTDIISFLQLAQHTQQKTVQNLWWGAGYNIVALPLAAGLLAPWGIILTPAVGAALMALSTIIVAINAETLKI
ncbi:copper-translocating P-type ATPase [Lactobacillus xylocopicola]